MPLYLLRCPRSCHLRFKPHYKAQCTLPTTTPTQEPSHRLALPRPAHLSSLFLPRQLPSSGRPSLPNLLTSNPESHPSQSHFLHEGFPHASPDGCHVSTMNQAFGTTHGRSHPWSLVLNSSHPLTKPCLQPLPPPLRKLPIQLLCRA